MKQLMIDDQTISDLGIFGKTGKPGIFDLYNKTVTQGGSDRMKALFRSPLADDGQIEERVRLFGFFAGQAIEFPVSASALAAVAWYLDNTDVRTRLQTTRQSIADRLKDMVASDPDSRFVENGVLATINMFRQLHVFINEWRHAVDGSAWESDLSKMSGIVYDPGLGLRHLFEERTDFRLETKELSRIDEQLRFVQHGRMLDLLGLLYELDVSIAVGKTARERRFCFGKALPRGNAAIQCKGVRHPGMRDAIPNDVSFDEGHNVLFLTGANMAGKSTLMKSLGLAIYLGHMGFPVAAKELRFAVKDGVFTSINLADNLGMGASHYYMEVLRVKQAAQELSRGKHLFIIFDELFRGTNVKDAHDATIAITAAFCRKKDSQFIISTHIMEAAEVLRRRSLSIQYHFLPTEMRGNVPVYPRVLREGITSDRQGMLIIQNEGILEMLDNGLKETEV